MVAPDQVAWMTGAFPLLIKETLPALLSLSSRADCSGSRTPSCTTHLFADYRTGWHPSHLAEIRRSAAMRWLHHRELERKSSLGGVPLSCLL